jgi:FkbM family methyltransferase
MFDKLKLLQEQGYTPNIIFDIGAYHGNWTTSMKLIYPTATYYLFEGINYNELDRFDSMSNINVYKNILLNDKIEEVEWFENQNTGDSFFQENTKFFRNTTPIKRKTIDLNTFMLNNDIPIQNFNNILIKIDCQGAEIPILKGSTTLFDKTDFIILEMPFFGEYNKGVPNFTEHIKFMDSIGFIPYDILEQHNINNFNMQIDMLFINTKCNYYKKWKKLPFIYSIMINEGIRQHVINYVKNKKKGNQNYKVIDIGGSVDYTNWSHSVTDYIVEINPPPKDISNITYFKLNVNFETEWDVLFNFVKNNGKFDFCICSHIIEDISLPQVLLQNINKIAKEGFISIFSKYREFSKIEGDYLGYIHHRWIYSIKNNKLLGFPKVNFIDKEPNLINIGDISNNVFDLSFFWKNDIDYSFINNNYLGPTVNDVKKYYNKLLNDDIDILKNTHANLINYHMEYIKSLPNISINGNFISVIILIQTFVTDLEILNKVGYIPYDIIYNVCDQSLGKNEFKIIFINKSHILNKTVQELLY